MSELKFNVTISHEESEAEHRAHLQRLARERKMWHPRNVLISMLLFLAILCFVLSAIVMLTYSLGGGYDAGICSNLMFTSTTFGVLFFWIARHAMPRSRKEMDAEYHVPIDLCNTNPNE